MGGVSTGASQEGQLWSMYYTSYIIIYNKTASGISKHLFLQDEASLFTYPTPRVSIENNMNQGVIIPYLIDETIVILHRVINIHPSATFLRM